MQDQTKCLASKKPKDKESSYIDLLNFVLVSRIPPEILNMFAWKNFTQGLNRSYIPVGVDFLFEKIKPIAYEKYLTEIATDKYTSVLLVYFYFTPENSTFIISLAINEAGIEKYVADETLPSIETATFIDAFLQFCDKSVIIAKERLTTSIHTIIHNIDVDIDENDRYNSDLKYYKSQCLSLLLKKMINFETNQVYLEENPDSFRMKIKNFSSGLKLQLNLASATEFLLKNVDKGLPTDCEEAKEIILSFIGPIHMASNYYHPKFKGTIVEKPNLNRYKNQLNCFIHQFNDSALKDETSDEFSKYFNESQQFIYLFRTHKDDPIKFWNTAKQTCPSLASFALNLLNTLIFMKELKIKKIYNFIESLNEFRYAKENIEYVYLLSLYLDEF